MMRYLLAALAVSGYFGIAQAETVRIITADNRSPFARGADQELPGFTYEYVQLVAAQAGLEAEIEVYPWSRAQNMAQQAGADVMIFDLTRTEAREPLYDWVTLLVSVDWTFISNENQIDDITTAGALDRIGARSVYLRHLESEGLTNVDEGDAVANFQKLAAGRVSAVFTNSLRGYFIWTQELGFDAAELQIGAGIRGGDLWLGASPGYDAEIMRRMDEANAALIADGTYAALFAKYFGDLPIADVAWPEKKPSYATP